VEGIVFRTEQAAYLAGFLAAKMADHRAHHVVSSVGGIDFPPVEAYIAGFEAGAKRADPRITVLHTFTNDFSNRAKCRSAALDQIARGSQVVFDVAGACGIGALEAAKQKHVFGVGVDIDQSNLGKFILTSVTKNLNLAVYDLARRLVKGNGQLQTGGIVNWTLGNHGVQLGKFSPQVPRALRSYVLNHLAGQIEQGKIRVPATLSPAH
jgi:basic membrane protein A